MLKIKTIGKTGEILVDVEGTIEEITSQTAHGIHGVYKLIKEQDPELAELFKLTLLSMLNDLDCAVWNDEKEPHDVVEVVRCKDCKHWLEIGTPPRDGMCGSPEGGTALFTRPRDFCSHAKRKENDND